MTEHFKYEDMTDEELIDQLREGDRPVMDYICDKYKNLVRSKAKSMYILGGDSEDLIQEGMIGLFKAVRDYDCGRDASFYTFADLCISRQMYTAVQASQRLKHTPLKKESIPAFPCRISGAGILWHCRTAVYTRGLEVRAGIK